VRSRDPRGYYAALHVSPDASDAEINLAFKFLKEAYQKKHKQVDVGKIREAYEALGHPLRRAAYDEGMNRNPKRSIGRPRFGFFQILIGLLVVSLIVVWVLVGPELKAHLTAFEPGDELVWSKTGKPAGTVLAYSAAHSFREGVIGPAYQVRPSGDDPPRWYPAGDIKRHCKKSR